MVSSRHMIGVRTVRQGKSETLSKTQGKREPGAHPARHVQTHLLLGVLSNKPWKENAELSSQR